MKTALGINVQHDDVLPDSVRSRLSPEFAAFYDANFLGRPAPNSFAPAVLQNLPASTPPGSFEPVVVGSERELLVTRKYSDPTLPAIPIVVYTPAGVAPEGGWPVTYNIHGGGWVVGTRHSSAPLLTRMCATAKTIVVSPEYRLAPQTPYPAAVEDCYDVLLWIWEQGKKELGADVTRFVIGGTSAGGNLSCTMINMLLDLPDAPKDLKFKLNSLCVPVTDVTANDPRQGSPTWDKYPSWTENAYAPLLSINKMMWYRNLYVPNEYQRLDWHASPMLAPSNFWASQPPTWVGVVDTDLLRDEGIAFHEAVTAAGVPSTLSIYVGIAHPSIGQSKALKEGKRFQDDCIEAIRAALWD
ncbi:hypothetical protein RQP46_006041 [Phenoliferia psychrophenolica]